MDRLLRITALAASGATLLWLAGCGGTSDADSTPKPKTGIAAQIEARNKKQAKEKAAAEKLAAERAEAARLAEAPSIVTKHDMKRGHSLQDSKSYMGVVASARFTAEHEINLLNLKHTLDLYAAEKGRYPKDTEEFMREVVHRWDMELPELYGEYEYWWDPSEKIPHERLKKRPIGQADPVVEE